MTAVVHQDLTDHSTWPSPEDDQSVVLVHTAWAGWYYETPALEGTGSST
ncbi:MAG: hypothetical protein JWN19_2089 [Arthrobacter sp.]|nr:hypothetical protein [Arthrobacter sp.]